MIKDDLVEFFQFSNQSDSIDTLSCNNQTFIALIPKKRKAARIHDFSPISLLNSSYKIVSKCLAARLSPILNSLFDDSLGRTISDCFLVTQETLHLLHSTNRLGVMLKLNFEKAFDNVNWEFLLDSLKGFRFGEKWIA